MTSANPKSHTIVSLYFTAIFNLHQSAQKVEGKSDRVIKVWDLLTTAQKGEIIKEVPAEKCIDNIYLIS